MILNGAAHVFRSTPCYADQIWSKQNSRHSRILKSCFFIRKLLYHFFHL